MDDPDASREELDRSLGFIRAINRRLGGTSAAIRHLARWGSAWTRGEPVSVLDVATGSADIPVAIRRWGLERGLDVRITGVDLHETTLDLAREHVVRESESDPRIADGIELRHADARDLVGIHGALSFDYVHAGMFLHHLPEIEVLTVLRVMERLARRGIIWNDLTRSGVACFGIKLLTLGKPEMVRHDARVSVEAGFTKREVLDIARRLELHTWCRFESSFLTQRFTLAGEKPL